MDLQDENTQLRAEKEEQQWLHRADQDRIDPSEQIPEADLLEQQTPLDPSLTDDDHGLIDRADSAAAAVFVDDADRWEQQLAVPSPEDEYPHKDPDDGVEAG